MNATNRYLDRLAGMHAGCSDYRLAQLIGTSRQLVSAWRLGKTQMDDRFAMRVGELIRVDPLQVIAEIRAERELDPATVQMWRRMASMAAKYGHAVGIVLAILATSAAIGFPSTPLASMVNDATAAPVQVCILCKVALSATAAFFHAAITGFLSLVAASEIADTRHPHS